MKRFLLRILDPLLANRYFLFASWVVAMGVVVFFSVLLLWSLNVITNLEYSVLDIELRFRANIESALIPGEHRGPSSNIVLLGIDENTYRYMRSHPGDMGLSPPLPRSTLAKMIDYLTNEGAKAIILDLEFNDAKKGDQELAAAIRRNGNVYAADRMDYKLKSYIDDRLQENVSLNSEDSIRRDLLLVFTALDRPYANYLARLRTRFMPFKAVGPMDLGYGPYTFRKAADPDMPAQFTASTNISQLFISQFTPPSVMSALKPMEPPVYGEIGERAFRNFCTNSSYQSSYEKNPQFLDQLELQALSVNVDNVALRKKDPRLLENWDQEMVHCYTYPVVNEIMGSLKSIGVPSIDYYQDAYIRSATVLYRGYKGKYYTYLGVRPALDLLHIDNIGYTGDNLSLNGRQIPLLDGQKVIINWWSPSFTISKLFKDYGLDPDKYPDQFPSQFKFGFLGRMLAEYRAFQPYVTNKLPNNVLSRESLEDQVESVKGETNNALLGGGHIYRLISAIDVIRLLNGRQLEKDAAQRMYNIPYYRQTGNFSFKDKIVVIGDTVKDIHRTPMSPTMFGPEVVAATLDMFLNDKVFIHKIALPLEVGIVLVLAGLIAFFIITFENLSIGFTIGTILTVLYWIGALILFRWLGLWLDMLVPSFSLLFSITAATLYRYWVHDREKHLLTNVFSKYVSPQIMTEIVKNPEHALENLKGGKKELTVLFSDLQGFTHQFENADPEIMVSQLNEYFDVMTEIILDHGGTYDKYMGDSIMAFFGAPAEVPDHAEMACRAALEMERALKMLNDGWSRDGQRILAHGIGISTGEMFVGNFGSKNIKNFTVMGSNVNLGARLEAFTRVARWPIIISARTWDMSKSKVKVRDLGKIQVKGFTEQVQVYGLESMTDSIAGASWKFGTNQPHRQSGT